MFDKLIDWLMGFWENIVPFCIVRAYDKGVMLRFGKFKKVIEAGFIWKIPFIDEPLIHQYVTTTMNLHSQSLVTLDKKNIVTRAIVKYEIQDMKTFLLDVCDAVDAIGDMTQGIIKQVIASKTCDECMNIETDNEITKKAKKEAEKWGIKIHKVTITDFGEIRSYRLFNEME